MRQDCLELDERLVRAQGGGLAFLIISKESEVTRVTDVLKRVVAAVFDPSDRGLIQLSNRGQSVVMVQHRALKATTAAVTSFDRGVLWGRS